jgi:hypothetical protein
MTKETRVTVSKNNFAKIAASLNPKQMRGLKESIGLRLERAFIERIKGGDPYWAPLSGAWAAKKGHGNQWYYTGRLENAIEFAIEGDDVHVGILKHEAYPESGSTVAVVAASLEYGAPTRNIPERPLFRPVFEEQVQDIVKDAAEDINKRVKKGAL